MLLKTKDIKSVNIQINEENYLISSEYISENKFIAQNLISMIQFGELKEKKERGKSRYYVTKKSKVNKAKG